MLYKKNRLSADLNKAVIEKYFLFDFIQLFSLVNL